MKRTCMIYAVVLSFALAMLCAPKANGQGNDDALIKEVLKKLNASPSVSGTADTKSYKILFDAYLELTKPPFAIGPEFNLTTIHPKMSTWSAVSGWAESNSKMVQAILKCKDPRITMVGLPYGREKLEAGYEKANIFADIGAGDTLRNLQFPYLDALDTIAAFATAEMYRLLEAGQAQQALDLAVAHLFVLRQFCDREFLAEKLHAIEMLSDSLANLRDAFSTHQDKISAEQFTKLSLFEIPFLKPERDRLFMPEADRVVAEALINEVFEDKSGNADPDKFTQAFAEIQSKDAPMTRFGAARRWRLIAAIHGSREASLDRLALIYDDWWRRWRVAAYDEILSYPTQFDRTNKIRYAAVLYSIQDVAVLFEIRNQLIAEVNGTAMAAGLCAYKRTLGSYPDDAEKTYTQFARKWSDRDPYDKELGTFKYRLLNKRESVDAPSGRLWIESGECVLYSQGQDHADSQGAEHTDDGAAGDIILWPPIKALARAQGQIE